MISSSYPFSKCDRAASIFFGNLIFALIAQTLRGNHVNRTGSRSPVAFLKISFQTLPRINRSRRRGSHEGSIPSPHADFARDNATNRAPGFFPSKSCFPGWITTNLNASPTPTFIPWHLWIVVPHASLSGT